MALSKSVPFFTKLVGVGRRHFPDQDWLTTTVFFSEQGYAPNRSNRRKPIAFQFEDNEGFSSIAALLNLPENLEICLVASPKRSKSRLHSGQVHCIWYYRPPSFLVGTVAG